MHIFNLARVRLFVNFRRSKLYFGGVKGEKPKNKRRDVLLSGKERSRSCASLSRSPLTVTAPLNSGQSRVKMWTSCVLLVGPRWNSWNTSGKLAVETCWKCNFGIYRIDVVPNIYFFSCAYARVELVVVDWPTHLAAPLLLWIYVYRFTNAKLKQCSVKTSLPESPASLNKTTHEENCRTLLHSSACCKFVPTLVEKQTSTQMCSCRWPFWGGTCRHCRQAGGWQS